MKSTINLVSSKQVVKKNIRQYFLVSVIVFSVSAVIAIGILIYTFYLSSSLNTIIAEHNQLESTIASNSEKKANAVIIKERLSSIQKTLGLRKNLVSRMNAVLATLPYSVSITQLEAEAGEIVVTLATDDLFTLDSYLDEKIIGLPEDPKNGILKVDMSSFRSDLKTGQYLLTLNFSITQ